jgi:RNA polymerase sigma factor (sigma-70 family)
MDAVVSVQHLMSDERKGRVTGIVSQVGAQLKRYVRGKVRSDADAEDVVQDVWERLVAALDAGPVEHVVSWLYTVARNRITDRYRRPPMASLDEMAGADDDSVFEFPEYLLVDERTPATELRRSLFWSSLKTALAELSPEQRQVFVWHELEGLSFQEMAGLTGENLNTLLSRKRYAVLHLRRKLSDLREEFFPDEQ